MTTSDEVEQFPLVIVHLKTLSPVASEVTADEGLEGFDIFPLPLNFVQLPVPFVEELAAKVAEGDVIQTFCCGPAAEVVAGAST